MRRPQLKLNETSFESSKHFHLDISPNQSLNNSLNQSDFNHTILRINEVDLFQMENSKSKALKSHHNNSKEIDNKKAINGSESDNQSEFAEILIHNRDPLSKSNDFYKTKNNGVAKDFNTIVFLLFLYFLQGIYLIHNLNPIPNLS